MVEFSEENGFDGYEPESENPGSSVLIATIAFCILSLAIIPCLVSLHKKCGRGGGGNDESNESPPETAEERVSGYSLSNRLREESFSFFLFLN